ncbi:hypothetical protein MVEG_02001 [Podila verticillata NRRL 6337]|nr:hypothetical protein MVEG_02001 [Podila verticillata NRRL 6337]
MLLDKYRKIVAPPALIQQGLADLDPDVDVIFQLTRGQEPKQITYCQDSPSIRLAPGTFCPLIRRIHSSAMMPCGDLSCRSQTSAFADLETCIVELMKAMAAEKFIGEADVNLAQKWVKNLESVGYKFPKMAVYNSEQVQHSIQVVHEPIQHSADGRRPDTVQQSPQQL